MNTHTSANLTDNAWVERINELRNDLEAQHSGTPVGSAYYDTVEWMLSDDVSTEYDDDDARFLRREAQRMDERNGITYYWPSVTRNRIAFPNNRQEEEA